MVEVERPFPGVKLSGDLMIDQHTDMVVLWVMPPDRPQPPKRPVPPKGQVGEPEYDLEMIEFRDAMEGYEADLRKYKAAKEAYAEFEDKYGGPYEIVQKSVDAADSLARDPKRFRISSKTRGYERLKNKGLPQGVEPGHGQAEQEERARQANVDLETLRRSDPVFGSSERAA